MLTFLSLFRTSVCDGVGGIVLVHASARACVRVHVHVQRGGEGGGAVWAGGRRAIAFR
jgi:hypothetical protein